MRPSDGSHRAQSSRDRRFPRHFEQANSKLALVLVVEFLGAHDGRWGDVLIVILHHELFVRKSRVEGPSPPRAERPAVAARKRGVDFASHQRGRPDKMHGLRSDRKSRRLERARNSHRSGNCVFEDVVDDDGVAHDRFWKELVRKIAASGEEGELRRRDDEELFGDFDDDLKKRVEMRMDST